MTALCDVHDSNVALKMQMSICRYLSVINFSSESILLLLETGTPGTNKEETVRMQIETPQSQPLVYKQSVLAIEIHSLMLKSVKNSVQLNSFCCEYLFDH